MLYGKIYRRDAELNEEIKNQFEAMIKAANNYTYYRKNWNSFSVESLGRLNEERSLKHDIFISELDNFADLVEKAVRKKVLWRVELGDERHQLGEFAEYMINSIKKKKSMLLKLLEKE